MAIFMEMIEAKWAEEKHVCVGLDPVYTLLPGRYHVMCMTEELVVQDFLEGVVRTTKDIVACYKPNIAFFESYGYYGFEMLEKLMHLIHTEAPDVPVILDAKRGDIGNTNEHYAKMAFDLFGADALTIHPYLGWEANKPFLDRADKGIFVLCRTSNPGAGEFQDAGVRIPEVQYLPNPEDRSKKDIPYHDPNSGTHSDLYMRVAQNVSDSRIWNYNGNCGLVTGATYPEEIAQVRAIAPDIPLLIPGVGKQGGDLEASVTAARHRFIINSSSGIIFADDPRAEAEKLHGEIQAALVELQAGAFNPKT